MTAETPAEDLVTTGIQRHTDDIAVRGKVGASLAKNLVRNGSTESGVIDRVDWIAGIGLRLSDKGKKEDGESFNPGEHQHSLRTTGIGSRSSRSDMVRFLGRLDIRHAIGGGSQNEGSFTGRLSCQSRPMILEKIDEMKCVFPWLLGEAD